MAFLLMAFLLRENQNNTKRMFGKYQATLIIRRA